MSQVEPTKGLAVPTSNSTPPTTAASESASRADTLTNQYPSEKASQEEVAGAEGAHAAPSSIKSSTKNNNEKGGTIEAVAPTDTDTVNENGQGGEGKVNDDSDRYLTGFRLFLVFVGLLLSIFLVSLDQTIIATALPVIASQFNALNDLTWVVSAYFFTQTGLILTFGQLLTITDTKWLYLVVIALFEIGSLFCAVAWNMPFLIFGRAVAGVGAAGIFISILTIIARVTRLEDRPLLFGAFGAVFAVSSVAGPLLGGVFTDHLTWRWCFYINLPFGALSILAVLFFLKAQPTLELPSMVGKTKFQQWLSIDWLGTLFCLGMIIPLLLALQWGGNLYAWNDKIVIALFCVFAVMLPVFVAWQFKLAGRGIMPLQLFKRVTQVGCVIQAFLVMMNLIVATYYIPFFYQASRGRTPTQSGIDILPYMLTIIISAALSGAVINFTGRYSYFLRFGGITTAIASGLLFTIDVNTPNAKLIGLQILSGFGVGVSLQNVIIACQAEWADRDELIPQATSIVTFFQLMGGVLGIAIAGAVFANKFESNIAIYAPGLDPQVTQAVKTTLSVLSQLPPPVAQQVVLAYVRSLNYVFIISVPTSVLACLAGLSQCEGARNCRWSSDIDYLFGYAYVSRAFSLMDLPYNTRGFLPDYIFELTRSMGVRGIARWSNAPPDGVKLISESVLKQHQARSTGPWRADLRTLRRHPFLSDGTTVGPERLLWQYISPPENVLVIIEDANAPKRADYMATRAEIRVANAAKRNAAPGVPDSQLELIEDPPEPSHYRNTLISFRSHFIEQLIDQLGGAWTSQPIKTVSGPMMGRATGGLTHRLKIEGFVFAVGSDWIVRVGSVYATGDQFRGVIMEIEYLPVDVLPYVEGSSAFLDAFTTSLLPSLPSEANFNSVIIADQEWAHVCGVDAPVARVPADDDIYAYGDEETATAEPQRDDWRRSAYMITLALRGEGLM